MVRIILVFLVLVFSLGVYSFSVLSKHTVNSIVSRVTVAKPTQSISPTVSQNTNPLAIQTMRNKSYPGGAITIEQTLLPGSNYNRYVVSYISEGLKIYGLLTVPQGQKPPGGWPVILFNHGYIPPNSYSTISSYAIMIDPLASSGYIIFKPDYRGNGNSQGTPQQPYISPAYVTDSMNALASIKKYKDANSQKIGVFGHSMGGNISLHELVITRDIKAAELMAGVVGDETSLAQWWAHRFAVRSIEENDLDTYYIFEQMIKDHGAPTTNPAYWNAIDPTKFIDFISSPVQIQVGTADEDVPIEFSSSLHDLLQQKGKIVDYKTYQGVNHNLVPDTVTALAISVAFFNQYLK